MPNNTAPNAVMASMGELDAAYSGIRHCGCYAECGIASIDSAEN
jgi:hypothetical protein